MWIVRLDGRVPSCRVVDCSVVVRAGELRGSRWVSWCCRSIGCSVARLRKSRERIVVVIVVAAAVCMQEGVRTCSEAVVEYTVGVSTQARGRTRVVIGC